MRDVRYNYTELVGLNFSVMTATDRIVTTINQSINWLR